MGRKQTVVTVREFVGSATCYAGPTVRYRLTAVEWMSRRHACSFHIGIACRNYVIDFVYTL